MTAAELCKKYDFISEKSLKTNFKRVVAQIEKRTGDRLSKTGRGDKVDYQIVKKEDNIYALTLENEKEKLIRVDVDTLHLANFAFVVFLGVVATPQSIFRGTYVDFLRYLGYEPTAANILNLKGALNDLLDRRIIYGGTDPSNEDWFFAGLYRIIEEQMGAQISQIKICREIADKNNMQSDGWVKLLKTLIGVSMVAETQEVFKMSTLAEYTGLTEAQLRRTHKLLQENNIYKIDIQYNEGTFYRKGQVAYINRLTLPMTDEERELAIADRRKRFEEFQNKEFSARF